MQEQQQQRKGNSAAVLSAIVQGWAATIYPFMRVRIGKNHPGIFGLIGLGWLVLWVAYTHATGLLCIIPLFLLGQISHSLGHARKSVSGIHTNYAGEPRLAMKLLRFKDENAAKRFGEPLLSLLFGLALLACGFAEGTYFVFGAAVLVANQAMIDLYQRRRVDDMRDAMVENEQLMGQVRKRWRA